VPLSLQQAFMRSQKTDSRLIRKRRPLTVEPLESRSLLAGDLLGVAGNFNADRIETTGMYNPWTGTFFLRDENSPGFPNQSFVFLPAGRSGLPIAGDWNSDGVDTVGIYVQSTQTFYLANNNQAQSSFQSLKVDGAPGIALPLAGDWNGDGRDELARISLARIRSN
jgi:hypothetical protein